MDVSLLLQLPLARFCSTGVGNKLMDAAEEEYNQGSF
jgi:hypothetical protein